MMTRAPTTRSSLRLPRHIVQPFPLRFRHDDLHVMAFFEGHPEYEAVEAMIQLRAGSTYSIRAILTRHDQSQVDHVNDDALVADFRGTERELCRREIDFETGSSGQGRRARLAFLSWAGERIVLDIVTVGQPDPKRSGLTDPGRHSVRSALPIMWRGATTLAGSQTKVIIDGTEYWVPAKIRAGALIAHQGYFTERFSMGGIRAGTVATRLLKTPDRFEVGAEWVQQWDERTIAYRVTAQSADGALRIAKLDGSDEIITAYAISSRLEIVRISLRAEAGPTGLLAHGLALAFDRDGGFSLSIEGGQDIVSGRLQIAGGGRGMGPTLKSALAYGMLLNEMLRHTDFITMGAHTMGTSSLDVSPTASTINAVGLVYKMYSEQFPGSIPVALSGNSPQPPTQNPPYADEPKTSSGSPTYPLDMIAALTPDHKYLKLAVVNATETEQKFDLSAAGVKLAGPSELWQMTGSSLDAANHVGQPSQVEVKDIPIGNASGTITVAPISVSIYEFPLAGGQ